MKRKKVKKQRSPAISITLSPDSLKNVEFLAKGFKTTRSAIINALVPSMDEARGLLSFYKTRKPMDYKVPESGFAQLSVYGHSDGTLPLEYLARSHNPVALQGALERLIPSAYVARAAMEFSGSQGFDPAKVFSYCLARELLRKMVNDPERPIGLQLHACTSGHGSENWVLTIVQFYLDWNDAKVNLEHKSDTDPTMCRHFEKVTIREKQYWIVVIGGSDDERREYVDYQRNQMEKVLDELGSI
jgi:hypothetical protein